MKRPLAVLGLYVAVCVHGADHALGGGEAGERDSRGRNLAHRVLESGRRETPGDRSAGELARRQPDRLSVKAVANRVKQPARDGVELERKPLMTIPPGTRFDKQPPARWSNIISFVEGRLASGDLDAVSERVRYYSRLFNLVMLANAEKDESGEYFLDKVAIGFSMKIKGYNTIVTSETQKQLGGDLGLTGSMVLDGNVDALQKVEQVAREKRSMLIDAPAVMLYRGEHKEMVIRYLIWVSQKEGRVGAVVWLLDPLDGEIPPDRDFDIVGKDVQFLPPNMREDRIMNVKGDRFLLGIPSKDAFALVRIPQGRPYKITDELRRYAGAARYSKDAYYGLLAAMSKALAAK